jgi:hypothetical protein
VNRKHQDSKIDRSSTASLSKVSKNVVSQERRDKVKAIDSLTNR